MTRSKSSALVLWSFLVIGYAFQLPSLLPAREGSFSQASVGVAGRWDVTVYDPAGPYPSWFEIEADGDSLRGRFVGKDGSARPIPRLEFDGHNLRFSLPRQYEKREGDVVFRGSVTRDGIEGITLGESGAELRFVARRAPGLAVEGEPEWGEPLPLIEGEDLSLWKVRHPDGPNGWSLEQGVLTNTPPSVDILTHRKFTNFKLHVEFKMPLRSNSGIYLRGRYEVQVTQDHGREPTTRSSGSIYGFTAPRLNASRPPGEWNTMDITLVGRRVTVVFNGDKIIENVEIPGITGGALDSLEGEPGPILLQGDHEAIQYRNIYIVPAR